MKKLLTFVLAFGCLGWIQPALATGWTVWGTDSSTNASSWPPLNIQAPYYGPTVSETGSVCVVSMGGSIWSWVGANINASGTEELNGSLTGSIKLRASIQDPPSEPDVIFFRIKRYWKYTASSGIFRTNGSSGGYFHAQGEVAYDRPYTMFATYLEGELDQDPSVDRVESDGWELITTEYLEAQAGEVGDGVYNAEATYYFPWIGVNTYVDCTDGDGAEADIIAYGSGEEKIVVDVIGG